LKKRRLFHYEIPSEINVYNDIEAAAEESLRRNVLFTALDFIINDFANCLEAYKHIFDLFSPVLNYLLLSCNRFEEKK
jgi:hypothetical protein